MEGDPALDGDTSRDPREACAAPYVDGKSERAAGRMKQRRRRRKKNGSPPLDLGTDGQGDAASAVRTPKKRHSQVRSPQHASGYACAQAASGKAPNWFCPLSCSETYVECLADTSIDPIEASAAPYVVGKSEKATSSMKKKMRRKKKKNRSPSLDLVTGGQGAAEEAVRTPKQQYSQTTSPQLSCYSCALVVSGESSAAPAPEKWSNLQWLCQSCDSKTSVVTNEISDFATQVELQNDLKQAVLPTCLDSSRPEEAHRTSPVVTTNEPSLEEEPKSLASTDPVGITSDNVEQPDKIVHVFNDGEIEGLDWSGAELRKKILSCMDMLNYSLPDEDDDFWSVYDDPELEKLNERLALHRIRARKISEGALLEELVDAKLIEEYPPAILEEEEYFEWYENKFEWYFDPRCCGFVGFQDYQRLVLREDTQYLHWNDYHETYMTYQGDQEYIKFYEMLSSETKWLANFVEASTHEWQRYEMLAFFKALKIAAGFNNILPTLIYTGFGEYSWSVRSIGTYKDYASLFLEIWKRVAKEKMSFLSAVKDIHDQDICARCSLQLKIELGCAPRSGGLRTNYDKYLADLNAEVEENEAYSMILEAAKKFVPRQKTYYDYAIKKLDIARKNGVIPQQSCMLANSSDVTTLNRGS